MNLKKIFFSYSRADASDFALRLAVDLKKEGLNIWIDQQDIRAGSEWDLEIEKALETCDCLLFIESENSVTSTNVLDEVYYALDEHKKVIPIIYHDSKTPFRIKRLQHIDFTKNYERGLANLLKELKNEAGTVSPHTEIRTLVKPFFTKSSRVMLIALALVIIAAVVFIYSAKDKSDPPKADESTELPKTNEQTASTGDTVSGNSKLVDVESKTESKKESPGLANGEERIAPKVESKKETRRIENIEEKKAKVAGTENMEIKKTIEKTANLHETFTGVYDYTGVEPAAELGRGYLKIEEIDEKKVNILSSFQFYFTRTNDTSFFNVFNGFAGCSSCVLKEEMRITDNDVAFGTRTYRTLKETQPGVGKAGDTIMNRGGNTSIRALVTLHLINKTSVIIKVQKPVATPISYGFIVEPFIYTFKFTKREY